MYKYKSVICGGTFDLFHIGHEKFLAEVLSLSDQVLIGITSSKYIDRFKNDLNISDFETRKKSVWDFIIKKGATNRVKIVPINTAYDPNLENSMSYQAIVVTKNTKKSADTINNKRKENDLFLLEVVVLPMLNSKDGKEMSSTRIRNGEVNRQGLNYLNKDWLKKDLVLPEALRKELRKPFGKVITQIPKNLDGRKVITIGDVTTKTFNQANVGQFLSIVDFQVQRKNMFNNITQLGFKNQNFSEIVNKPATISKLLFKAIAEAFSNNKKEVILVEGEEDLAVLPVLIMAPLGRRIYYGQPNKGMVEVEATEEKKQEAYHLLSKFTT